MDVAPRQETVVFDLITGRTMCRPASWCAPLAVHAAQDDRCGRDSAMLGDQVSCALAAAI